MLDRKKILNRFLSYVKIDTESDPNSTTTPSTEKQWTLARLLAEELKRIGLVDVSIDEHAYVMGIEKMLGIKVPERAEYIRVMFDEITRIMNHLMWVGTHGLDVGAMSVFLYAFRERESLIDCYEAVSGSRMHATYYRPGGVYRDLPDKMPQYLESKLRSKEKLEEINENRQGSLLDFIDDDCFVMKYNFDFVVS